MALIRWEPFREVEIMQRQINRLFDQMLSPQESDRLRGGLCWRIHVNHNLWGEALRHINALRVAIAIRQQYPRGTLLANSCKPQFMG
ncbi:Molecular chaperone IbpA, HSP20 family [Nostoc flagelliforme CCNUN1]|uniref:Molecular chaperone IbpA, HSP20 family n=1 Tax=Nostoc flagelliforme CCNUN1 TaxID=2038116 RepID=A0A2K8SK97_9NOSO|nr:hypothetical protein [Nostoc flagelliforme]AUB35780.1 Molecular chaperone IbpA, HSP20 family [Nostoc flagelliforme CCNUN1]